MSHYPNERGLRHNHGSGTFGESPASGPAPTTAGHHKHDILNKLDPRVDSTQDRRPAESMLNPPGGAGGNNIPAGTYGPHNSRIANALDPRVDSDLDGRAQRGGGMPGSGTTPGMGMGTGMTGAAAAGSAGYGAGNAHVGAPDAREGTYGPHNSRMANALDPRVDSDRDGRGGNGMMGQTGGMVGGQTGGSGYPHSGMTQTQQGEYGSGGAYGQPTVGETGHQGPGYGGSGAAGPHKSGLMNKLDPRVDSKTGTVKESKQFSERRGI